MPGNGKAAYRHLTHDATCFEFTSQTTFTFPPDGPDSKERVLELRLVQPQIDLARATLENAALALQVFLIETDGENIYEDVYDYDAGGDFLRHRWRVRKNSAPEDKADGFTQDSDYFKLLRCGDQIRDMLEDQTLRPALERHPIVQKLKTRTLYELDTGNAHSPRYKNSEPESSENMWYI